MSTTPGVALRQMTERDIGLMLRWFREMGIRKYIGEQFSSFAEGVRWLNDMLKNPRAMVLVIVYEGSPVGSLQLLDINWRKKSGELRIFIGEPSLWDHGIGTEAIRLLIRRLVQEWCFQELYLRVDPDNHRARHAYMKCGFRSEGIMRPGKHKDKLGKLLLMTLRLRGEYGCNAS